MRLFYQKQLLLCTLLNPLFSLEADLKQIAHKNKRRNIGCEKKSIING